MQSGPGFVPTFLYYFVGTTVLAMFVVSQRLDTGEFTGTFNPFQMSILFGILAGGVGAYFNSHDTLNRDVPNRGKFLKLLNQALNEMGYSEISEDDGVTVYERATLSKFFSGKLFLSFENNVATIAGRASNIKTLKQKMDTALKKS